jgi:DNA-binding response OmpR family regulator
LSRKTCGVLKFRTHDELVIAYTGGLLTRIVKVQTKALVSEYDAAAVRLELTELSRSVDLPVTIVEVAPPSENAGRTWVRLRFDSQCHALLEAFVLKCDPSAEGAGPMRKTRRLKIAVIDDNRSQREAAARPFRERGHEVLEAADGLQGLALCLKHEPDVILSDVQMPKADGWQLIRMLRARQKFARVPVLFLTTLSEEKDRLHGYRLGVDDYIEKPFSEDDLVARVERCIHRSSMRPGPKRLDALRGNLEHVSLAAVLSFFAVERKSGTLRLEPQGCFAVLSAGRVVRACTAELDSRDVGAEALYALLDVTRGSFEFHPGEHAESDSIGSSTAMLLMEHARRADEAAAGARESA